MVEVFIKYNPYKLETDAKINGEDVREYGPFLKKGKRLQEWIEKLPDMLREVGNDKNFHIVFRGISPDFEDLQLIAENAKKDGFNIMCEHEHATETEDKIPVIEKIFEDIQKCPYDFAELRLPDLRDAFEKAKNEEFSVDVIGTMSAGKSTVINALLAHKLMPSQKKACTAKITEIKDRDELGDVFNADVYGKDDKLIEHIENLTYEDMRRLNRKEDVSKIKIEGNIPFVSSDGNSLVLVDTPGPNSIRQEHQRATYNMIEQSSKTLVLYVLDCQFEALDTSNVLDYIAKSMSVGGKQSKDRFIFVVNKLDDLNSSEDSVEEDLEEIKKILEEKGIKDPNIFPASALTALDIRTIFSGVDLSNFDRNNADDETKKAFGRIESLNSNSNNGEKHFETYAPLIPSLKKKIDGELAKAKNENDPKAEALVHSGILSVEAAISLYVEKYAKTAKIKNLVDTFNAKLGNAETIEKLNKEIASNKNFAEKIEKEIIVIQRELQSGENAREFEQKISEINYKRELADVIKNKKIEIQTEKTRKLEASRGKLDKRQAKNACENLAKFAEELQAKTVVELEKAISAHVQKNAQDLLDQYKQRLENLTGELETSDKIELKPLELMSGTVSGNADNLITNLAKTERVKAGERWVENRDKHWWNPFTWFDPSGWYENTYKNVEYIEGEELAQKFLAPFEENLYKNIETAERYAAEQAETVKEAFKKEFKKLDKVLHEKLEALSQKAQERDDTGTAIKESEERLEWLQGIRGRIDAILEI